MADEKKAPTAPQANETITEKQALDADGKLKAGFAFRWVPRRDENGRQISVREFFKAGA